MRKVSFVGSLLVVALVVTVPAALAGDNWIGSWKANIEKSKFSPGPAPKSLTLKFEASPDGTKMTSETVDADGKATQGEWVSKMDGKDVPYKGNPNADTAAPKRIDDNTYDNPWKMAGKATVTAHVAVSKDGKTLTVTQKGKNAKGEAVATTMVMDKQ